MAVLKFVAKTVAEGRKEPEAPAPLAVAPTVSVQAPAAEPIDPVPAQTAAVAPPPVVESSSPLAPVTESALLETEARSEELNTNSSVSDTAEISPVQISQPEALPLPRLRRVFEVWLASLVLGYKIISFLIVTCARYVWRHPIHAAFNSVLIFLLSLTVLTGSEINKQLILGQISDQTVSEIIEASRFTRGFNSEDVDRSSGRELLRVGAPEWAQREAVQAILYHTRKVGLPLEDQAALLATVDIESGFNPFARASTTSACGLFQFVKRTGEIFGLTQSECMDPWRNAEAGVAHYLYNYGRRVQNDVGKLTGAERVFRLFELSYYLHHDGPESSNPNNDVKATILNGTQFLFKVYRVLQEEQRSQTRVPSFAEKFSQNFWRVVETVNGYFSRTKSTDGSMELGAQSVPEKRA